jgi:hypothetical protein
MYCLGAPAKDLAGQRKIDWMNRAMPHGWRTQPKNLNYSRG